MNAVVPFVLIFAALVLFGVSWQYRMPGVSGLALLFCLLSFGSFALHGSSNDVPASPISPVYPDVPGAPGTLKVDKGMQTLLNATEQEESTGIFDSPTEFPPPNEMRLSPRLVSPLPHVYPLRINEPPRVIYPSGSGPAMFEGDFPLDFLEPSSFPESPGAESRLSIRHDSGDSDSYAEDDDLNLEILGKPTTQKTRGARLQDQLERLKTQLTLTQANAAEELGKSNEQVLLLTEGAHAYEDALSQREADVARLVREISSVKSKAENAVEALRIAFLEQQKKHETNIRKLNARVSNRDEEISRREQEVSSISAELSNVQSEMKELQKALKEKDRFIEKLGSDNEKDHEALRETLGKLDDASTMNKALRKRADILQETQVFLVKHNEEISSRLEDFVATTAESSKEHDRVVSLLRERDETKSAHIKELQKSTKILEEQRDMVEKIRRALERDFMELREAGAELVDQNAGLQKALDKRDKELASMRSKLSWFEQREERELRSVKRSGAYRHVLEREEPWVADLSQTEGNDPLIAAYLHEPVRLMKSLIERSMRSSEDLPLDDLVALLRFIRGRVPFRYDSTPGDDSPAAPKGASAE